MSTCRGTLRNSIDDGEGVEDHGGSGASAWESDGLDTVDVSHIKNEQQIWRQILVGSGAAVPVIPKGIFSNTPMLNGRTKTAAKGWHREDLGGRNTPSSERAETSRDS